MREKTLRPVVQFKSARRGVSDSNRQVAGGVGVTRSDKKKEERSERKRKKETLPTE